MEARLASRSFVLAAFVLAVLVSGCGVFSPASEVRPVRPGSARDPSGSAVAGSNSEQAPAVSLADLSWGWNREEGGFDREGESTRMVSYQRDDATSKNRSGLHRVWIAQSTIDSSIPRIAVDFVLVGFQELFLGELRGTIDTRAMVYVNGPSIGRRSKWSSIEYTAADGVPTKVFSVVFLEGHSLAAVSTVSTQGTARLLDIASLAQDVADRLSGRDSLELPVMRTTGT